MSQKSLIPEAEFVGVENVMPPVEQLPAVVAPPLAVDSTAIRDLRAGFMMMPAAAMQTALAEFKERRDTFRKWLKEQLRIGIHYGHPPGTEPRYADEKRRPCNEAEAAYIISWRKGKDGADGKEVFVPLSQWQAKPSLYKAGADFLCDVLGARDEYESDLMAWKQLGEPKGTFVMTCRLISRVTGECLGEGRGCRKSGFKGGDENNAIKMAKKCAKVDAVLNAWGLADLFTQDLEDPPPPPPVENPTQKPGAPTVQPRGERFTKSDLETLYRDWKAEMTRQGYSDKDFFSKENFVAFCRRHTQTNENFDPTKADLWTDRYMQLVRSAIQGGQS